LICAIIILLEGVYTNTKCQEQRKASESRVPDTEGHITPGNAHGQNADQHDPSALQVNFLIADIDRGGDSRPKNIGGQSDGRCLIDTCLAGKGRAQDNQNRNHDCRSRQPRKTGPDTGSD